MKKEGVVTYFVGPDNYFSHAEDDKASLRFVIATLLTNGHMRSREVERSVLGIPHRTLMNWTRQLADQPPKSFYAPVRGRKDVVFTPEKAAECGRRLDTGLTVAEVARQAKVKSSTLHKALHRGRIPHVESDVAVPRTSEATSKSDRTRTDAQAAEVMGTACTRVGDRLAAVGSTPSCGPGGIG